MTRFAVFVTMVALVLLPLSGATSSLNAETVNCTPITSVPTTITAQGVYCFTKHITTSIASGFAVEIAINNVVLDLNGYKLQGLAAGSTTQALGIVALDQKNITVRNGTVRGFRAGIVLTGAGHIVEDMRVDSSTAFGVSISGVGTVVRNNVIVGTGGSTAFGPNASANGIQVAGALHRVLNNEVLNTLPTGSGSASSILAGHDTEGLVVEGNRLGNSSFAPQTRGIDVGAGGANALIVNNRITQMSDAILCFQGNAKIRDNLRIGGTSGYFDCIDAGNNN